MLISILLGCVVGSVLGLTGSGGAILAVPLLLFGLNLEPKDAIPIALLSVMLSATSGAFSAFRNNNLRYKAALLIAIAGIIIAPLGVLLGSIIPNQPLIILFSMLLAYIAIQTLRKPAKEKIIPGNQEGFPCEMNIKKGKLHWSKRCAQSLFFTGGLVGFLSGLLGLGGGFIIVPALQRFSNIPIKQVLPTALLVISLVSISSVAMFIYTDRINWGLALPFSFGSLTGMLLAQQFKKKISNANIVKFFGSFLIVVAAYLFLRALNYVS